MTLWLSSLAESSNDVKRAGWQAEKDFSTSRRRSARNNTKLSHSFFLWVLLIGCLTWYPLSATYTDEYKDK